MNHQGSLVVAPPKTYENPRDDDPWDNDAVQWLLLQPGGSSWTRHNLAECLRHQPARLKKQPDLVKRAEQLAVRHGVRWVEEPYGRGSIFRLYRTDPGAPEYPRDADERQSNRGR